MMVHIDYTRHPIILAMRPFCEPQLFGRGPKHRSEDRGAVLLSPDR
jgi:hypothetical protein